LDSFRFGYKFPSLFRYAFLLSAFLLFLVQALSAQAGKPSKIPDGEAHFTAEELEDYYLVYKNSDVRYLRTLFDSYLAGTGGLRTVQSTHIALLCFVSGHGLQPCHKRKERNNFLTAVRPSRSAKQSDNNQLLYKQQMRIPLLLLTLIFSLAAHGAHKSKLSQLPDGILSGNTYSNSALELRYDIPGW
jgi:hypothetical protein